MQYARRSRPCAGACTRRSRRARPTSAATPNGTTARSSSASSRCATRRRGSSATRNYAEVSLVPKMAQHPDEVIAFLRDLARAREAVRASATIAELAAFAREELGLADARAVGPRLRVREAQGRALRVQRAGRAPVLSRGPGAGRACSAWSRRSTASRSARRRRAVWHPDGALLRDPRPQRRAGRRVLLRPLRARRQAGRRVDGRRDQPPARARRTCSIRSRT